MMLVENHGDAVTLQEQVLTMKPTFEAKCRAHIELSILYSDLALSEKAKAQAAELLKLVPHFSVDIWGERIPYKDPEQANRDMAALRKAGLK